VPCTTRPPHSRRGDRPGVGVAATNWIYVVDSATEVELTVEPGVVVARTATQDIGTGSRSAIASVVCAELDLPPAVCG
jgi:xanthine dehydrogenase YagR molybdenum-binding subunit